MTTATITLQVDADLAQAYKAAPESEQTKLSFLLNLWLRELSSRPGSLSELMDEMSDRAAARGLTAKKLEKLLNTR